MQPDPPKFATGEQDWPAGHVEHPEQWPPLQENQGGQSLFDAHAGPHCPALLPGSTSQTAGEVQSTSEEQDPGPPEPEPSGRPDSMLESMPPSFDTEPEELPSLAASAPLLLLDPAPLSAKLPVEEPPLPEELPLLLPLASAPFDPWEGVLPLLLLLLRVA